MKAGKPGGTYIQLFGPCPAYKRHGVGVAAFTFRKVMRKGGHDNSETTHIHPASQNTLLLLILRPRLRT